MIHFFYACMAHARRAARLGPVALAFSCLVLFCATASSAAELIAKNGMTLRGRLGYVASVAENPLVSNVSAGGVDVKQIALLDDGLRRTYLSWHQIRDGSLREADANPAERVRIRQNVAKGRRRVGSIASIVGVSPFDAFGRRTFSVLTPRGRLDIVQGITEITPLYTKVEGLAGGRAIQWDSRIATSSIPRETLSHLLRSAAEAQGADGRLQIVRLLFNAERYNDARVELEDAIREFPELAELEELRSELRQYSAQRLIDEMRLRRAAGQYQRVQALLRRFPSEGVATETLLTVSELLQQSRDIKTTQANVHESLTRLSGRVDHVRWQAEIEAVAGELQTDLNNNTIGRLGDFLRLQDDPDMPDENKLSLLISGWVVGSGNASQNLSESVSLYRTRTLVRDYLRSQTPAERASILDRLAQEEAGSPTRVAAILGLMKPPLETAPQEHGIPGYFRLSASAGNEAFQYEVQLPDEYDPYRRYPVVMTLHSAGRSPAQQIEWWAGVYNKDVRMRLGQAARHGYIVVAPNWTRENQRKYEYSDREHAVVLGCLRDVCRRFSVDSNRVFLSGHSVGGDAAWDLAVSHPDLWAGVIPIVATSNYGPDAPKYTSLYWENGKYVPMYFVAGQLDGDKLVKNGRDFDRYMTRPGYDFMLIEYIGRGHEHFFDEIHRLFEWMNLHERDFFRRQFECVSMRPYDNFYWCLELDGLPDRSMVDPLEWPAPRLARPAASSFRIYENGKIGIKTGAREATVWLSPNWIDLDQRVAITVNGRSRNYDATPQTATLLEDARTRGDRQFPFWARLDLETGKRG